MARSLPVQDTDASTAASTQDLPLAGTVAVFDPAMCCATGVCGPGVDPALLTIARDLRWLETQGVGVHRVGLSQEPQQFIANARVAGLMQAFGDGALPAVLVDGAVLTYGRYPTRDEMVRVLTPLPSSDAAASSESCCAPGSGCC